MIALGRALGEVRRRARWGLRRLMRQHEQKADAQVVGDEHQQEGQVNTRNRAQNCVNLRILHAQEGAERDARRSEGQHVRQVDF